MPETIPDASTDAIVGMLLVHVPPDGVELSAVVLPAHTVVLPVIAVGGVCTVTTAVLVQPVVNR